LKRALIALLPIILAACGSAASNYGGPSSQSNSASGTATLSTRGSSLGQILVDATGKTLYIFEADRGTQSACSAACAQVWPPLTTAGAPNASGSAKSSLIGTTPRTDGRTQVTYAGHPVYTYVNDANPGDTNGEGSNDFGAGWDALTPAGDKIEADAS
jgi:predicted lipoprotein with Yx(FWY)xxD motif